MQISLIYGGNIMSEDEKKRVIQEIMSFYLTILLPNSSLLTKIENLVTSEISLADSEV